MSFLQLPRLWVRKQGLSWETASRDHVGGRKEQQDRVQHFQSRDGYTALIVLADGAGGHRGGTLASQTVIEVAKEAWQQGLPAIEEACPFLKGLAQEAHDRINAVAEEEGLDPRSTVVFLLLAGNRAVWTHVGDSRLYHFRNGEYRMRTVDDSVPEMLLSMGKITEEEMATHPKQGQLTRSLGGKDHKPDPECEQATVGPGDGFLLCSDGVWEAITPDEMGRSLRHTNLAEATDWLVAEAAWRGGEKGDNVSVGLARIPGTAKEPGWVARQWRKHPYRLLGGTVGAAVLVVLALLFAVQGPKETFQIKDPLVASPLKGSGNWIFFSHPDKSKQAGLTLVRRNLSSQESQTLLKGDYSPNSVALGPNNGLYWVDQKASIRRISPDDGQSHLWGPDLQDELAQVQRMFAVISPSEIYVIGRKDPGDNSPAVYRLARPEWPWLAKVLPDFLMEGPKVEKAFSLPPRFSKEDPVFRSQDQDTGGRLLRSGMADKNQPWLVGKGEGGDARLWVGSGSQEGETEWQLRQACAEQEDAVLVDWVYAEGAYWGLAEDFRIARSPVEASAECEWRAPDQELGDRGSPAFLLPVSASGKREFWLFVAPKNQQGQKAERFKILKTLYPAKEG